MTSQKSHVIIIGAGIVDANIAYHLLNQKVHVILIVKEINAANNTIVKSFD